MINIIQTIVYWKATLIVREQQSVYSKVRMLAGKLVFHSDFHHLCSARPGAKGEVPTHRTLHSDSFAFILMLGFWQIELECHFVAGHHSPERPQRVRQSTPPTSTRCTFIHAHASRIDEFSHRSCRIIPTSPASTLTRPLPLSAVEVSACIYNLVFQPSDWLRDTSLRYVQRGDREVQGRSTVHCEI